MSIIPLDLQRRFEQRWASRFPPPIASNAPKLAVRKATPSPPYKSPHPAAKTKSKTRRALTGGPVSIKANFCAPGEVALSCRIVRSGI
jgi:hypothetical protein